MTNGSSVMIYSKPSLIDDFLLLEFHLIYIVFPNNPWDEKSYVIFFLQLFRLMN